MTTVSIVLHRTAPKLFSDVMASLKADKIDHIYVIDNSPDDSLRQLVESWEATTYLHVANNGFGAAHNVAIRMAAEAGSDFHLVLNPDVRWEGAIIPTLIRKMQEAELREGKKCALIQPTILYPDGRLQHTCRLLPTPLDVFGKRFLPYRLIERRLKRYLLPAEAYDKEFDAVYMQGSFMLFRTELLQEAGGFDERFFMYPEDIDITRRLHEHYLTLHTPAATIIHDHAAASSRWGKMLRIHIVNIIRYFNKWGWFLDPRRRKANRRLLKEVGKGDFANIPAIR